MAGWSPWLAGLVCVAHLGLVAFMVLAPFSNDDAVLAMYVLTVPLLWLHWVMHDDTCALTILERKLRGLERDDDSFIYKIVSPVYKIRDEQARVLAWAASVVLWIVAFARARKLGVWPRLLFG